MEQKPSNLERLLNPRAKTEIRRHAASAWTLAGHDPELLAEWCLQRIEKGLCDPMEHRYLLLVIAAAHAQMGVPVKRVERFLKANKERLLAWSEEEEKQRVAAWERRCEALIERDNARRYAPKPANWRKSLAGVTG